MANLGYMQLVRHCNQYCRICSNPETPYVLDFETACREIDDFAARDYEGVILTGGEPSLSEIVPQVVRYALGKGLSVRMITNGSRLADGELADRYIEAGLKHFHVSLYSSRAEVHDAITGVKGSFELACKAIDNLGARGAAVNLNSVINRFNCDHLDELARMIVRRFPFVDHVVINNLDPSMGRAETNREVLHRLADMEVSLTLALRILAAAGKTFRVERVPLCYMAEFAWASTETRKIIKREERMIHFLDEKGTVRQTSFRHHKAPVCEVCSLDSICAGLFEMGHGYEAAELAPLFVDKDAIVRRVTGSSPDARGP
ncbi:MAG: radical SAM protein [Deltaproteobacteria bacterium]|nr:radical SAM protein [Deltaproteobacteria bacterium]